MRVLIDTNILVSAALFPQSVPARAYMKAVMPPNDALVCDYSMDELRRVYSRKFSHRIQDFEHFVSALAISVEIVPTPPPSAQAIEELAIRDVNDRPILRAAFSAKADVLLTGDKDFLESGIVHPEILTAAEFLSMP
ncbi:MAG: putative toxin-antitoxin system toxin component, PIN family [Clostridiales Family XIII bacterium]|jgi:putative PIN family toxin of toxin-antitoxin system|nr:putative toxin-antitoxin system toxin component, PIN family [Clostridiales Family XIII bacterium]